MTQTPASPLLYDGNQDVSCRYRGGADRTSYTDRCICRERRWDASTSKPSGRAQCVATAMRCSGIKRCGAEDYHQVQTEPDRCPPRHETGASVSSLENMHGKLTLARVESGTAASAGKPSTSRSCSTDTAVSALRRPIQATVNL